jgi:membrane protease YdiL (CAAX protease family)
LLRNFLRGLSSNAEFAIVVLVAFGLFLPNNLSALVSGAWAKAHAPHISNAHLYSLLIFETAIFLALAVFLRVRDWTLARIGMMPTLKDSLIGVGLNIASYAGYAALWFLIAAIWPQAARAIAATRLVAPSLDIWLVIAVCIVNPIFEETFLCGYIMSALKPMSVLKAGHGAMLAINVSTGIRLCLHLYQGPLGVLSITPMGLIFSYWYARTGRLWPLIVAHALMDLVGLLAYTKH